MKLTGFLAAFFFATSIGLAFLNSKVKPTDPMEFKQPAQPAPVQKSSFAPSQLNTPVKEVTQ